MQTRVQFFPPGEQDDRSTHAHRQLIGVLGMVLPLLLWMIAAWRPTMGLARWLPLRSVSAYYHTGSVAAFVGILIALAVFLFTYRGYGNAYGRRDRVAGIVAGGAAVLVAFFPTRVSDGLPAPSWWVPYMGTIHHVAAMILFGSFIYFSLFLFPKARDEGTVLARDKRRRNAVYRVCGWAMVACVGWVCAALLIGRPIFWAEVLALEFFALSWLVKGRAAWTAAAVGRRLRAFGTSP